MQTLLLGILHNPHESNPVSGAKVQQKDDSKRGKIQNDHVFKKDLSAGLQVLAKESQVLRKLLEELVYANI